MAANRSLSDNKPQLAAALFREFDDWYADEEDTANPEFREKLIRLWGLAELQAGAIANARDLLEKWFEEFPEAGEFRAFIRFQLASACLAAGDAPRAKHHWARFLEDHSALPECDLVRWLWAECLLAEENFREACGLLEEITVSKSLPQTGKILAQAALALALLSEGQAEAAISQFMEGQDGGVSSLWRSILAPALADALLREDKPDLALKSAAWFNSNTNLLAAIRGIQRERTSRMGSIRGRLWANHWRNQLSKASASLNKTVEAGFGVNELYLLRLRIYLSAGASTEAFYLAKALLDSAMTGHHAMRQKVYCYAIEASMAMHAWDAANDFARRFLREYPESPELPGILFLQARCSATRKHWSEAIAGISRLITDYPDNPDIHAWRFSCAKWLAADGKLEDALNLLEGIKPASPDAWREYLAFEQANCLHRLRRTDAAELLYNDLLSGSRYLEIAQQAGIALLRINLEKLDQEAFENAFNQFTDCFPDSPYRLMVDLLLGSFLQLANRLDEAIEVYEGVAVHQQPEADHARRELSGIFQGRNEYNRLLAHAKAWIRESVENRRPGSEKPWLDCLICQRNLNVPALGQPDVLEFLDSLLDRNPAIPCTRFLDLLENQWRRYAVMLKTDHDDFIDWVRDLAASEFAGARLATWSGLALYHAGMLMREGRTDSADTIRIHVLTTADKEDLDQHALFEVASVAHRYDFPESLLMLENFLEKHVNSDMAPHCMLMLARECSERAESGKAIGLLQIVCSEWPDASIHVEACLLLATLQYNAALLDQATATVERLLQNPEMHPTETARCLLLRARIDFDSGNLGRCRLNCERILTLYPDLNDIIHDTNILMESLADA